MPARTPVDLEAALEGRSPALAAKDAVYHLARSQVPGVKERLSGLVREGANLAIRRRAAIGLSLVVDARPALLDLLDIDEPVVLSAVLLSLARVGTIEDLKSIRTALMRLSGHDAEQAGFAEVLMAHRLGLGLDVVAPIPTPPTNQLPDRTRPITLGSAHEAVRAWSRFVPNGNLGFEADSRRCSMIRCARRDVLFIPSVELATQVGGGLLNDRTIVGATAAFERESASWYHDLWIFAAPAFGGVELQAWTQGGRACYTGSGTVAGEELAFEIRTVESSRLALAHVRGQFTKDGFTIGGTVGDRARLDSRAPALQLRAE